MVTVSLDGEYRLPAKSLLNRQEDWAFLHDVLCRFDGSRWWKRE